jgi:hypothetical protein
MNSSENIGKLASVFLDVSIQLKIYHWQTKIYARHKASCELISKVNDLTDQIIETLQGIYENRLRINNVNNKIVINNHTDTTIVELLKYFTSWLKEKFPEYVDKKNTDIYNLRDELLGAVNQTLYLFTFK